MSEIPCRRAFAAGSFLLRLEVCRPLQEVGGGSAGSTEILLVAHGGATPTLPDLPAWCGPASVLLRGPGHPKRDRAGESGMVAWRIEVRTGLARRIAATYLPAAGRAVHCPAGTLGDLPARLLGECARRDVAPLLVDGMLRQLIVQAARLGAQPEWLDGPSSSAAPPEWLARAVAYMQRFYGRPLKVEQVARLAGVNPAHFSRVFRRYRGMSAKQFLSSLRLREAAAALAGTAAPISDIALGHGFADQAHFSRAFKRWSGRTPDTYRRAARAPKPAAAASPAAAPDGTGPVLPGGPDPSPAAPPRGIRAAG